MFDFFSNLFSTTSFMPHGHCYLWRPDILWLHVISDAIIALAYASIPFALVYFVRKRKDLAFNWIFLMFGAFILACGATHALSIWTVWEPVYRLDGVVKAITALASIGTAFALWPLVPKLLALPSAAELEAVNAELRKEIADRKKAEETLEERNRALIEAEYSKTVFFTNVSHELRTPLTLILAPTETLLSSSEEIDPKFLPTIGTIHNNALRLLQLVNSLLDFAKIEAKQLTVKREALDIRELSQGLFQDFSTLMSSKNIEGKFIANIEVFPRMMDRFLFERIVFNLLSNAVKFTPEGGSLAFSVESLGDQRLKIVVADSGLGISSRDLPHLFKKFWQLEDSATRRFEGTGLGLSLVKQFSELLGGEVEVESEVGKGSKFQVTLDAPYADQREESVPIVRARFVRQKLIPIRSVDQTEDRPLVLIAEDNDELASYIQSLLVESCRTQVVSNGLAALDAIQSERPSLILSDVMMPEMDGIVLCQTLKSDPDLARIPLVLLTALTHRDALLRGWEAGADEYLFKPFHPHELMTRVRSLLRRVAIDAIGEAHEKARVREQILREQAEIQIAKLQEVENELRRTNRMKDEFLATISHELRTPMVAILGWSELLYNKELDEEEFPSVFETLHRNAVHQSRLIESLLDISRMITGKFSIEIMPVDLAQLVQEAAHSLRLIAEAKNIRFEITSASALRPVAGDPMRLKQVVWNLLSNAIKFSEKGAKVEIVLSEEESCMKLAVRDFGEGIEPEFVPLVFEQFLQENQSNTRKHGGLGLGLSIVKRIVDLHGGSVRAESAGKGQGALFTVMLPYYVKPQQRLIVNSP